MGTDLVIHLVIGTVHLWRQDLGVNVVIWSSTHDLLVGDKISLATLVSEAGLSTVQGLCTTGKSILQLETETGKEAWIRVIFSLKCLEKV